VAWVLEVTYESAAGLRHDFVSQLKLGGLFVPVVCEAPLDPFVPITLVLLVDGVAPLRVATRLTVAGGDSLCVEVLPEAAAPLAESVERICAELPPDATTERRGVRLLADAPARAPSDGTLMALDRKIAAMSVGEKIRAATHGNRDERVLLGRDRAGPVQAALLRNPKVTVDEVLALARAPHLSPDAAEAMAEHPSWSNSAQVSFALVRNPRTPLPLAVELVGRLLPSDLRVVAKGLGVRSQVAQAARKKLLGAAK
jgi:hypothetical protein